MIDLMRRAYQIAWDHSDDMNTKCGALLFRNGDILACGANKFVPGCNHRDLNANRVAKLLYIEHAEREAIFQAAQVGVRLEGATMVVPWASCAACARAIVLVGIKKVVAHKQVFDRTPPRWREEIAAGLDIFDKGKVEFELLDAKIGGVKNLFNGEVWTP